VFAASLGMLGLIEEVEMLFFFLGEWICAGFGFQMLLLKRMGLILWVCRGCRSEDWVGDDQVSQKSF